MTAAKHSPGPFRVMRGQGESKRGLAIADGDGLVVANIVFQPGRDNERANASLFAAAPDMLEALEGLLQVLAPREEKGSAYENHVVTNYLAALSDSIAIVNARAAIAKAEKS